MNRIILICCLLLSVSSSAGHSQEVSAVPPTCEIIKSEMILNNPPFAECHASTLAEINDCSVQVAFFGGSFESAPDVKIWSVTLKKEQWTRPVILADGKISDSISFPCWNPVLFKTRSGKLYLFYKVGKNPREWFGMMKTSDDEGHSWTEPIRLPDGFLGPIKNKPVELPDGKLLCPSSTETSTEWKVQMELYNPTVNHWQMSKVDEQNPFQVIQPTILEYSDSTFRILCRSKNNAIISSVSRDNGVSWGQLSALSLPNPNSGIDGITLHSGYHLLVYNPTLRGGEWSNGRNRLNLAWSADGLKWTDILILEKEESGEFSYPAIIQSSDGMIHITYTHNRNQVKYWKIKL